MVRRTTLPQQIGKYEVLEGVGRGAMGVVFSARDPAIGRAIATQNTAVPRSHVLPEFQQIVAAGGPRAPEAARYVNILIPAALKAGGPH